MHDDVLRPAARPGSVRSRPERLRVTDSSRRFEKRVITHTPTISTTTSSTAEAAPCGYWIASIFELTIVPTDVMLPPPTVCTVP